MYDEDSGYSKEEVKAFKKMSVSEQLVFLKSEVSSVETGTKSAGTKAKFMRSQLKEGMKLQGLFFSFSGDEKFMNEDLRDFLNTKEDGSNYTFKDMILLDGWIENLGNAEHQHNTNGGPNKKYVNILDGREAVFDAKGNFIKDGIDAGTYNYGMPFGFLLGTSHGQYDMKPFFRQYGIQPWYWKMRVGSNYGFNSK